MSEIHVQSDPYYRLSDTEWSWVDTFLTCSLREADALREYLDNRIAERLVAARQDERAKQSERLASAYALGFRQGMADERQRTLAEGAETDD